MSSILIDGLGVEFLATGKGFETNKETLGKLVYKGLLKDSLSFLESGLNVDRINCTEMGFLYKEVNKRKIQPDHTYWFLHNDDGDKRGSALHTVEINTTTCGEVGAFAVADMLRTNNTLTELDISYNPLSSRGVTPIAKALKLNKTLKMIFLDTTECGNDVVAIADMLHSNQTLTKLYLHNEVGYNELNN